MFLDLLFKKKLFLEIQKEDLCSTSRIKLRRISNTSSDLSVISDQDKTTNKTSKSHEFKKKSSSMVVNNDFENQNLFFFSEYASQTAEMMHATTMGCNGPLLPTSSNLDLASITDGILIDNNNLTMPLHTQSLPKLKSHLAFFCHDYNINIVNKTF